MSDRLDLMRPILSRYQRRFSVLDFGAGINIPAIGTEIAKELDAVVTCVEKDITLAQIEAAPHIMWLKKAFTADDLQMMNECEHFDVVIALNIAHWFPKDCLRVVDLLRRLGRYVFIQVPKIEDETACEVFGQTTIVQLNNYFKQSGWNWVRLGETVQFPGHMARDLWMYENRVAKRLTRTNVDAHTGSADTAMIAGHDICRARLKKRATFEDWIQGLTLWNFCRWGGVWPTREYIVKMLEEFELPATNHGDVVPHNFIIDGERLHLIDGFEGWEFDDKANLAATIEKVRSI